MKFSLKEFLNERKETLGVVAEEDNLNDNVPSKEQIDKVSNDIDKELEDASTDEPKEPKEPDNDPNKRISELQAEMDKMKQEQAKKDRETAVQAALNKHGIPEWRRKGLVIPDEEDPDAYCAGLKQDLITQNLISEDPESVKTANAKNVEEASDALLESIIVK